MNDTTFATPANGPPKRMIIDGKLVSSLSERTFENRIPATGALNSPVYEGDAHDVEPAVAAARRDFNGPWREIFGPVACVVAFDTLEEAIQIANAAPFGLAGGLWTNSLQKAHQATKEDPGEDGLGKHPQPIWSGCSVRRLSDQRQWQRAGSETRRRIPGNKVNHHEDGVIRDLGAGRFRGRLLNKYQLEIVNPYDNSTI